MDQERLHPLTSYRFDADRLEQLQTILPEAFADGKINWDVLRAALGEHLEDDEPTAEHFGLFWPGKREARRRASQPSKGTLVPVPGEGVNEATTRNIFIEADNLEALKLLQKSYAGRVKLIYIDPPYNTGKDFVYRDDFQEERDTYFQRTGQVDEKLNPLTTNRKSDGRFHSNWMTMMFPRLLLARTLLTDDGVFCVSIDDNEVHNLRLLLNEVFGESNFAAQITILNNPKGRVLQSLFAQCHDYLLIYKNSEIVDDLSLSKTESEVESQYPLEDEGGKYRLLELRNTHRQFGRFNRRNLFFPIYIDPTSGSTTLEPIQGYLKVEPIWDDGFEGCWTWDEKKVKKDSHLLVGRLVNNRWKIFRKSYSHDAEGNVATKKLQTVWTDKKYHTEKGQAAFDELIPGRIFQSPKPVDLVKTLAQLATEPGDIIMDYFAGSGTTAQSILELSAEPTDSRQFILVQVAEATPPDSDARKAGYETISETVK